MSMVSSYFQRETETVWLDKNSKLWALQSLVMERARTE